MMGVTVLRWVKNDVSERPSMWRWLLALFFTLDFLAQRISFSQKLIILSFKEVSFGEGICITNLP